jgi:hypothetical protein
MRSIFRSLILVVFAAGVSIAPARAEQTVSQAQYPTVVALAQTALPFRDRIDLARRFLGVTDIPPRPTSAVPHRVGDTASFWVTNSVDDRTFQVKATLRGVGDHLYLWVEDGAELADSDIQALTNAFDQHIYNQVRDLWGSEDTPGIDGDPHVYGLFAANLGSAVAAYYVRDHTYPKAVVSTSNEHEMLFFNLDAIGRAVDTPAVESTSAHEFQHMIRDHLHTNEDTWMDEGFSVFTELYLGFNNSAWTTVNYLYNPGTQLNDFAEDELYRAANYGAALLFITYFYERYGLDAIKKLSADPANGLQAVDNTLHAIGQPGVNDFFGDWVLANELLDPTLGDGRYGYKMLPNNLPSALPLATVTTYPYLSAHPAHQYSADYYVLNGLQGKTSMDISIALPDTVSLVPTTPVSGQHMWYSNRGDESDTSLTHSFDLSNVSKATLHYKIWYWLEKLWDFGYVAISADGGKTWTAQAVPHTTSEDPHDETYGAGYTGQSDGWLDEQVPLDAYAGKKIQVRFEVITDDAVTEPGMVIDDVSIPEIGYSSDFESNNGGWQPAGWIWTDNRLPQEAWIQVVQRTGKTISVSRWSAPAEHSWSLPLIPNVEQAFVAVSLFAPLTTVAMPYTLNVSAR